MSEVIKEFREYLVDRIVQTRSMLNQSLLKDGSTCKMTLSRYLELLDMNAKLNKLVEDADIGLLDNSDPNDGWIPCSERLPEEAGTYVVTTEDNVNGAKVRSSYYNPGNTNIKHAWIVEYSMFNPEVIAWRELKPYEKPVL